MNFMVKNECQVRFTLFSPLFQLLYCAENQIHLQLFYDEIIVNFNMSLVGYCHESVQFIVLNVLWKKKLTTILCCTNQYDNENFHVSGNKKV